MKESEKGKKNDEEEDFLGSIGFMFDAQHVRVLKTVSFNDGIQLQLNLIGEDPGRWVDIKEGSVISVTKIEEVV